MASAGTRSLTVSVGSDEVTTQLSSCKITSGESDSDFTSFADAAAGGAREYRLDFTAVQDYGTHTMWTQMFDHPGTTVAFVLRPFGNAVPSAQQPHFVGNAIVSEPDGDFIGGEANTSATSKFVVEGSWACTEKPLKVTTP